MLRFAFQHEEKTSRGFGVDSRNESAGEYYSGVLPGGDFSLRRTDMVVGGVAIASITSDEIVHLVTTLIARGATEQRATENHIVQTLVAVLPVANRVVLYASISGGAPLYYTIEPGRIRASNSLAVLREMGVTMSPDRSALPEYLTYRTLAPGRTHITDVRRILAGECVVVSLASCEITSRHRWMPSPACNRRVAGDIVERLGEILSRHISSVISSEKHPAVLLSGGNDSSILALMTQRTRPGVPTYTTSFGFADPNDKEISYARTVAESSRLRFQPVTPTAEDYLTGWVDAVATAGEPLDHLQTVLLHLLYAQAAKDGTTLLVCGQMADALLGDSIMALIWKYRCSINTLTTTRLHRVMAPAARSLNIRHPRLSFLMQEFGHDLAATDHLLWTLYRYGDPQTVCQITGCNLSDIYRTRQELVQESQVKNLFDRMSVINYLGQAPGPLGQWANLAAAQGIRFFYPFLVPEFVTYLYGLPWREKFRLNHREPKHALRSLLRSYGLREEFITRPKQSFGFKTEYWACPGALFQPVVEMASSTHDPKLLRTLQEGTPAQAMVLWTLLNYYLWHRLIVDGHSREEISHEILDRRRLLMGKS